MKKSMQAIKSKEFLNPKVANNTQPLKHYYHGRGIAIWGGTYINIHNNKVYDSANDDLTTNIIKHVELLISGKIREKEYLFERLSEQIM